VTRASIGLTDELQTYILEHSTPLDVVDLGLIEETSRLGSAASMQVAPEQALLIRLLVAATGTRQALEIGTFTGLSSLAIARALPPDGRLLCCDINREWTAIAESAWEAAGVADRIELRLGPAIDTLRQLPEAPIFDFAFLDADKGMYPEYREEIIIRLNRGGLFLADNVLWRGDVVAAAEDDPDVTGLRRFNQEMAQDDRLVTVLLPVGDGLTIARRV
jgi:caffeoyl-CoA O-methyltransferase